MPRAKTVKEMIDALTAAWKYTREYWESMEPKWIEYYYDILYYGD